MHYDPGQETLESSQSSLPASQPYEQEKRVVPQSQAGSESTLYQTMLAPSPLPPADQLYDQGQSIPAQSRLVSEPTFYPDVIAPPPPPPMPRKTSRRWLWISLVIVGIVIIGAVTTTLFFVLTSPTRAVNQVVQNYYTAVEQQEYTTAFTSLDSSFLTSTGQQVTLSRAAYIQTSRTADRTDGKVTAYTITTTSIASGTATVAVEVTRSGTVRQVEVQLQQVGSTWEIDQIRQA
jgi:hypothetical protein